MAKASEFRIVLVTCGSTAQARKIAKAVVGKKLAACVNLVGGTVESIYWWKGKVESAKERLLMMKTSTKKLRELEAEVRRVHSYETPEFLVVAVVGGSKGYLAWMEDALG